MNEIKQIADIELLYATISGVHPEYDPDYWSILTIEQQKQIQELIGTRIKNKWFCSRQFVLDYFKLPRCNPVYRFIDLEIQNAYSYNQKRPSRGRRYAR